MGKPSSKSKPKLLIDWCSHEAAKFACEKWHYSKCMPAGKLAKFGVWESEKFIGTVIYGRGASPKLASSWGSEQTEIYELTRIALKNHVTPVSKIISITLKKMKKKYSKMKAVVSFADPRQDHVGTVYQAANWIFYGTSDQCGNFEYKINGKWLTARSMAARYKTSKTEILDRLTKSAPKRRVMPKLRYIYTFDENIRLIALSKSQPYPKRAKHSNDATDDQSVEGGAEPTRTLQLQKPDTLS